MSHGGVFGEVEFLKSFFLISNSILLEISKGRNPSKHEVYKRDTHLD